MAVPNQADFSAFIQNNSAIVQPPLVPEIKLHLATDITPLWKASEKLFQNNNVPPPFWSFAWPGGQALSRYLLDNPEIVRGKRVLDFASGSGLVAFAAHKAGAAHVIANDVDPVAITAIHLNAALNTCSVEPRAANMIGSVPANIDIILVGDFCYEWPAAGYAMEWLRVCVEAGISVLLADPGRPHLPKTGLTEIIRYDVPVSFAVEDAEIKTTAVYRVEKE